MLIAHSFAPTVEDDYGEESGPELDFIDVYDSSSWAGDICGACGQEFTIRKAYREHMLTHSVPRRARTPTCECRPFGCTCVTSKPSHSAVEHHA
jgi:hypothetical protein